MARNARYGKPDGAAELREYAQLVAATFAGEIEPMQAWIDSLGAQNVRVLRGDGKIDAGLSIYDMGQFFGGRSVPCWGLAGVAIPSHARGRGCGYELMAANLREQVEDGPPLAVLYPASTAFYCKFGYEQAGHFVGASVRPLELRPFRSRLHARPLGSDDWPALRAVYTRARQGENGSLDRNDELWERKRRVAASQILQGTIIEREGKPEAYLLFTLTRQPGRLMLNMAIRDWAHTTAEAGEAMMAQLYGQRSVVEEISFQAAPNDARLRLVVHDGVVPVSETMLWMLRVVRVRDALTGRGWPAVEAEAAFTITDDVVPENCGSWRLRVKDGKAEVKRERRARATLDIRGLAALYSGFQGPAGLRRMGLLEGDDQHDGALAVMFAGPAPWMADIF